MKIYFCGLLVLITFQLPAFAQDSESQAPTPDSVPVDAAAHGFLGEEEISVPPEDMLPAFNKKEAIFWQKPDYSKQESALGYVNDPFKIPAGLESRVSFWIDIYSKYSTDEGLLHDSQYINLVYESVSFKDIMRNSSLTPRQKTRAREKRVNDAKKVIAERLKRLQQVKDPAELKGEELRYWTLFANVDDKNKFIDASKKGRLRFQLGQKDRFYLGLYYSGRYIRQMEEIFKKEGMPIELTRLPFVESSFNVKARSKVGASGVWQFMRYSAKRLLKMSGAVDERNDPLKAAVAAARLLKINYTMLNDWPLAVTGYNHGPAGVLRMTKKYKTTSIVDLADERGHRFGFASANFYASFLAALQVEQNADKFFGTVYYDKPLIGKEIILSKNLRRDTLLQWFDNDIARAQLFNPHLQPFFWRHNGMVTSKHFIRLPNEKYEIAMNDLKSLPASNANTTEDIGTTYHVETGDTLSEIARQFGVKIHDIIAVNGLDNPRGLRAGQKILIPK